MGSSGRLIVSILVVVALAIGFWTLILAPKREQADRLGAELEQATAAREAAHGEVAAATAAKRSFPADYRQLVVLGQAAPAGDETASLLVELEQIANSTGVTFKSMQLESAGGEAPPAAAPAPAPQAPSSGTPEAVQAAAAVPPTEVAASLSPLGASIGPAGLYVMPYALELSGDFFAIARFVRKVDALVWPSAGKVDALVRPSAGKIEVNGRLITISGLSLTSGSESDGSGAGGAELAASITVTTYLAPPGQGLTAGATPSAPAPATAEPPATAGGGGESAAPTSETVAAK